MNTHRRTTVRKLAAAIGSIGIAAALAVALPANSATAGPPADRMADAGMTCFEHLDAWHCGPQVDDLFAGEEPETVMLMTWGFDENGEPDEFWGTELLVHDDVYGGQPCPQDPRDDLGGAPGPYIDVEDLGVPLPYVVCHHFDSPNT